VRPLAPVVALSLGVALLAGPGSSTTEALPRAEHPQPAAAAAKPRAKAPRLTVDVRRGRHRISDDIYGVNFADAAFAKATRLPVDRWGGNTTETYNWQVRGANHAQDYYFENFPDCWDEAHGYCRTGKDYSAVDAQIAQDRSTRTTTLLNLPAMGWVAKAVAYDNTNPCSYPAAGFDPQDDHDPYHPACGSGKRSGQWLTADPTTAGTPAGTAFATGWVQHLVATYGDAQHGGVGIYELGNEPALWSDTHHDFHPQPTTYDELWSKARDLATAVKQVDPTARTLGPAEWGWPNYFCSAADDIDKGCSASSPDRAAHGGTELSAWYLQQFARAQQQSGKRLLDYFDLHYYPQGSYTPVTDVTRPLYDRRYTDPSWIDARIGLLPRMRAWVKQNYPGTKISLSEYNLDLDITTDPRARNVIEADALGIFGREGLDLATYWPQDAGVPEQAFRIFRNYDGRGHGFGDRGVRATSSDQTRLSVYAARTGRRGPLTVVVVNKTGTALRSAVRLEGVHGAQRATTYQYAGRGIATGHARIRHGAARATYPAMSVTLLKIRLPRR
jgi:hypothetical protein